MPLKISAFLLIAAVLLGTTLALSVGNAFIKPPTDTKPAIDFSMPVADAERIGDQQVQTPEERQSPIGQQTNSRASSAIEINGDKLNMRVANRPLKSILAEIAVKASVKISYESDYLAGERVSIDLQDTTLLDGIRRLTGNYDCFFFFDGEKSAFSGLSAIWLYPKGHGSQLAANHSKRLAINNKISRSINDSNGENRAYGFEQLILHNPPNVLDIVDKALQDSDGQVRLRALNMAVSQGVALPQNMLGNLIINDPSAEVRGFALTALTVDTTIDESQLLAVAESASYDSDPLVVAKALEIIGQAEFHASGADFPQAQKDPLQDQQVHDQEDAVDPGE